MCLLWVSGVRVVAEKAKCSIKPNNDLENGIMYGEGFSSITNKSYHTCALSGNELDLTTDNSSAITAVEIFTPTAILENFPSETFIAFGNLEYFKIDYSLIILALKETDFKMAGNLKTLVLTRNTIPRIESGAFSGAPLLESADLRINKIQAIEGAFDGLSNLKSLDLSENKLLLISPALFKPLKSLCDLNLREIKKINMAIFVEQIRKIRPSLKYLGIDSELIDERLNLTTVKIDEKKALIFVDGEKKNGDLKCQEKGEPNKSTKTAIPKWLWVVLIFLHKKIFEL